MNNMANHGHEFPRILAHRGTSEAYTENGLMAFQYVLDNGITGFETDFHLTADGVVVVMHDNDIKRTTTGEGIVEQMTLAQIKQYKLKNSDETVPTADELFALFDDRKDFYIELEMKPHYGEYYGPRRMDEFLDKLYASAKAHLGGGTYVFTGFDIPVLMRMKERHPDALTGLICAGLAQWKIDAAVEAGCYSIAPVMLESPKELVPKAKAAGLMVNLWHSETLDLWRQARDMGADVSTNNFPVAVLKAIRESGE